MAIALRAQRQQSRHEALQLISSGVPPTDATSQLTVKWGCSRRTSLRDIELAQGELANALNSVVLQQMVGWLAAQYQRLAAKAECDGQYASAVGALNALRAMVVQPQLIEVTYELEVGCETGLTQHPVGIPEDGKNLADFNTVVLVELH